MHGSKLLRDVITKVEPCSVLDIGCGLGEASKVMCLKDFSVTGLGLGGAPFKHKNFTFYSTSLSEFIFLEYYDMIWCSHVLEHVRDVGSFLDSCLHALKDDGLFCLVVPTDKPDVLVDGHLSFFTPAHLIYQMVLAGFDMSRCMWYTCNRDIAVVVRKHEREDVNLNYDTGDLASLSEYFPVEMVARVTDPWLGDHYSVEGYTKNS